MKSKERIQGMRHVFDPKLLEKKRRLESEVSNDDAYALLHQIGNARTMNAPKKIISRCKYGYPTVTLVTNTEKGQKHTKVSTAEVNEKEQSKIEKQQETLPGTLLWLTCPRIKNFISKLESVGFLSSLQEKLNKDPEFQAKVLKDNESYKNWLKGNIDVLLTAEMYVRWMSGNRQSDPSLVESVKQTRYGNAGVTVALSIKCLHAHLATFLSGIPDEIGRIAYEKAVIEFKDELEISMSTTDGDKINVKNNEKKLEIEDLHLLDCLPSCVKCKIAVANIKREEEKNQQIDRVKKDEIEENKNK